MSLGPGSLSLPLLFFSLRSSFPWQAASSPSSRAPSGPLVTEVNGRWPQGFGKPSALRGPKGGQMEEWGWGIRPGAAGATLPVSALIREVWADLKAQVALLQRDLDSEV